MNKANTTRLVGIAHHRKNTMHHRIVMLRQTVVSGVVARVGDELEVSEMDAKYLVAKGKAELKEEKEEEKQPMKSRHRK